MIYVDQDQIVMFGRLTKEMLIDVAMSYLQPALRVQLLRQRDHAIFEPGNYLRQIFDDFATCHAVRCQCGICCVAKSKPTDQNSQMGSCVHRQGDF